MTSAPIPAQPEIDSSGFSFPLQADETVLQLSRRHWWYLWPNIIIKSAALLGPILVLWFIFDAAGAYDGVGKQIFWVLSVIWAVYWGFRIFMAWYQYRHDIWVITNQRIVDVFKKHPFNLRVSSADLINVQDISVERNGILQTTLDFGDIVCQTSGANEAFRLAGLSNPRQTQALIDQERDRERLRVRGI